MRRYFKVVLALAALLPACDAFVCSQARIKAIEIANKGVEQFTNRAYEAAERDLRLAIQTDPTYEKAYYNLGKVYQAQRKWDKAADAFESAVQRSPDNANFYYDLGEAYLEAKQLDKAEGALKKATTLDDKLFKAFWRLGLVYMYEEKPKEADLALRQAIELNPRMDKPFLALGQLYLNWDADKEAAQVFAECVRANDSSAECYNFHGIALKSLHQFDQAVREFKTAIDLDNTLFDAVYNCGMTYAEWYDESHANEQKQAARDYLQKYVATGGGKDGAAAGFVRAANDKLYALSGP
ncbi:MAG: tetratricopeptide repeat protein [Polyangia bacterium]|jgi:Tfp pilus assembly protein PilF